MDTSGSTAKELKYEADSASRFFRALLGEGNPDDRAALYTFNWEVREQQPFTRDLKALDARLKLLHGEAGTAMYDAVYLGAQRLESRQGRKVIVVVTDGGDTVSRIDVHKALEAAQLADAVIYAIVVMPITNDAGRNIGGEHALEFMAQGTGGRTFLPTIGAGTRQGVQRHHHRSAHPVPAGLLSAERAPDQATASTNWKCASRRPDLRVSARNGYYGEVEGSGGSPEDRISRFPRQAEAATAAEKEALGETYATSRKIVRARAGTNV